MEQESINKLKNTYPKLLEKSYDFMFDDGWYDLVNIACHLIDHHLKNIDQNNFKFTQIKEKFGGLRMYSEGYSDDFIEGVVSTVESLSFRTCEITGNFGVRCYKGGWIRTLSEDKIKELGYSLTKAS